MLHWLTHVAGLRLVRLSVRRHIHRTRVGGGLASVSSPLTTVAAKQDPILLFVRMAYASKVLLHNTAIAARSNRRPFRIASCRLWHPATAFCWTGYPWFPTDKSIHLGLDKTATTRLQERCHHLGALRGRQDSQSTR